MEFRQRFFVNLAKKDTLRSSLVVFGRFLNMVFMIWIHMVRICTSIFVNLSGSSCLLLGCWVEARVSACRWARAHDCLVNWFTRTQARRRECQVIAGWVAQTPQIAQIPQFSFTCSKLPWNIWNREGSCAKKQIWVAKFHFSRPLQLPGIEWRAMMAMDIQLWGSLEWFLTSPGSCHGLGLEKAGQGRLLWKGPGALDGTGDFEGFSF